MDKTMKAAVARAFGKPLAIEEVAVPRPGAGALGMTSTRFSSPPACPGQRILAARPGARLLRAASQRPLIHRYSTDTEYDVEINNRTQTFRNTNLLVRKPDWDIKVSKTGFINEAGECLRAGPHQRPRPGHRCWTHRASSRIGDAYASAASCRAKSRWRRLQPGG